MYNKSMKVILWMGMSLNSMIARDNSEEDFISHDTWLEWLKWIKQSGCLVWGRKTHQIVKTWPKEYFNDIKNVKKIIVSSDLKYDAGDGFSAASSPQQAIEMLSDEGFSSLVLTGGSKLNSSFAQQGLIDEVILNVEPVIIGKGIPLFSSQIFDLKLSFTGMTKLTDDLIQLKYKVQK